MAFDAAITEKSRDLIVLERARERIARGWCQYTLEDERGNVCTHGALYAAERELSARYSADRHSTLLGFNNDFDIVTWNNEVGRTQAEVLARFDAAIEKLAGRS